MWPNLYSTLHVIIMGSIHSKIASPSRKEYFINLSKRTSEWELYAVVPTDFNTANVWFHVCVLFHWLQCICDKSCCYSLSTSPSINFLIYFPVVGVMYFTYIHIKSGVHTTTFYITQRCQHSQWQIYSFYRTLTTNWKCVRMSVYK